MRRGRLARAALLVGCVSVSVFAVACSDDANDADVTAPSAVPATATSTGTSDSSVCDYYFEWLTSWRFPLQPDPHAAYSYVMPRITDQPVAFEVTGELPRAPWTSWMVYSDVAAGAAPISLVAGADIVPDDGAVNPFVPGNRVLEEQRSFRLLVLPQGVDPSAVAEPLQGVPAANVLTSPTDGRYFIIANRVYNAYPGYNRGGAGGAAQTPFPTVRAVDYETGQSVDCASLNLAPDPAAPTDMPADVPSASAAPAPAVMDDGQTVPIGGGSGSGAEYAPQLDPSRIEFTRPPLLPGADVSSIPPADNCAGYLGAATSTTQIGLIRMPHVATWFETKGLTEASVFEQQEATYISFTQYGSADGTYEPGSPNTASLGNAELAVDATGGATVVVWPRSLTAEQQEQVFAHARQNGWALLRGDAEGPVTSSNLLIRMKGADPTYPGGYAPTADVAGVPCYFDDNPDATSWSEVTGDQYVASGANIGPGAPQGVNCSVADFLDDQCLTTLQGYITETGGRYTVS